MSPRPAIELPMAPDSLGDLVKSKFRVFTVVMACYIWQGGPSGEGIPARVMDEIDQNEAAAERLIGWVQLSVVIFFASLYMIAPRAEGASGENFVPVTPPKYRTQSRPSVPVGRTPRYLNACSRL